MWNLGLIQIERDRRRHRKKKASIWKVKIRCTARRFVLADRYAADAKYLGRAPHFRDPRSVTRQLRGQAKLGRLTITKEPSPRRRDRGGRTRGGILATYTFTLAGMRYARKLGTNVEWRAAL